MGGLADSRHAPGSRPAGTQNGLAVQNSNNAVADSQRSFLPMNSAPTDNVGDGSPPPAPLLQHTPVATAQARLASRSPQRPRPPPSAPHELARYIKIVRRLKWKLPFLEQGYGWAVDRTGADPAVVSEAELMFKLDFFEYYMLIERALVHLLGVFGVEVSAGWSPPPLTNNLEAGDGVDHGRADGRKKRRWEQRGLSCSVWAQQDPRQHAPARHRYHANVLAALDRADNPLHGILGKGEVREQLGRAKDLRNRWKTAGDEDDDGESEPHRLDHDRPSPAPDDAGTQPERVRRTRKVAAPLESYRLEYMLKVVFEGLDKAFGVAEQYVMGDVELSTAGDADMFNWAAAADDDDQWKFMVDAMDWEAV